MVCLRRIERVLLCKIIALVVSSNDSAERDLRDKDITDRMVFRLYFLNEEPEIILINHCILDGIIRIKALIKRKMKM